MGYLLELIQRNRWEDLSAWLDFDGPVVTYELSAVDRLGRTPLHYVCAKQKAPARLVGRMFDRVSSSKVASRHDICGNSLLHGAATCGNVAVLSVLLEKFALYSITVRSLNDIGMSPLMMAWKKYLDDTFTLFGRSSNRVTPLIERHIENLLAARTLSDLKQPGMGGLMELWQKGLEICSATWKAEFGYSSTLLHTMAIVGGRRDVACPTIAMWLATKIRAEDLATPDHDGNTPLHLAAMYNELKTIPLHTDKQKTLRIANRPSLVLLVEAAPQVAVMRNNVGRLPVHCAIVSGKAFMNGIVQLIHANPACLNQRDSLTLLPPCLLAATVPSCRLSTAFELLRLCPEIVQQGIKQSNDEMSVERNFEI